MTDISEKQKKKAEKLLNGLKTGQQKIPTAVAVTVIQTVEKEVVKRIDRIKNNLEIMSESKGQIIEDLNYLKEHQAELTEKTGLTFESFIKEVAGYSKGYFYQLTANYEFLKSKDKIDLLDKVDTKIIEEIKKIDDTKIQKEYLNKAETLTRADIKSMRERVSPDYSEKTVRPSDSEDKDEQDKTAYVYPEKQPNKELDKFKIKVNKKIQYQIDMFESYIKQLRKKKKEKVQSDAQILAYQIVITNLKELLKEL